MGTSSYSRGCEQVSYLGLELFPRGIPRHLFIPAYSVLKVCLSWDGNKKEKKYITIFMGSKIQRIIIRSRALRNSMCNCTVPSWHMPRDILDRAFHRLIDYLCT